MKENLLPEELYVQMQSIIPFLPYVCLRIFSLLWTSKRRSQTGKSESIDRGKEVEVYC